MQQGSLDIVHGVPDSSSQHQEVSAIVSTILQLRKLRLKEVK